MRKKCHNWYSAKDCSISEVGCKFIHNVSSETQFRSHSRRNFCPYQHQKKTCTVWNTEWKEKLSMLWANLEFVHSVSCILLFWSISFCKNMGILKHCKLAPLLLYFIRKHILKSFEQKQNKKGTICLFKYRHS